MERHKKLLVLIIALIALLAVSCDMAGIHTGLKDTNLVGTWESEKVSYINNDTLHDFGIKATLTFAQNGDLVVVKAHYIKDRTSSVWNSDLSKNPEKTEYDVTILGNKLFIYDCKTTTKLNEAEYKIEENKLTILDPNDDNKEKVF